MNNNTAPIRKLVKGIADAETSITLPSTRKQKFTANVAETKAKLTPISSSVGRPNPDAMRSLIDWAYQVYDEAHSK